MKRIAAIALLVLNLGCTLDTSPDKAIPGLYSWNEGAAKTAIVDFVEAVSTAGSDDYLPEHARIAVFDNDGTLWAEQPLYFQFMYALDRVKAMSEAHPEKAELVKLR